MAALREELEGLLVGQLVDSMQKGPGEDYWAAAGEVERRKFAAQTVVNEAQIEAAKSATEAAEAAKTTADYTRRNARYMLLSVIAVSWAE
jgi:predicted Rossmann-fold nucleotide-binding protein